MNYDSVAICIPRRHPQRHLIKVRIMAEGIRRRFPPPAVFHPNDNAQERALKEKLLTEWRGALDIRFYSASPRLAESNANELDDALRRVMWNITE